jgi:hypothetical protein
MSLTPGLIVPVDVSAYCVGSIDAHEQTQLFAGATTMYTEQTGQNSAFMGSNVTRDFDQSPLWALEEGLHLHWAAPDSLTHAAQSEASGDLDFPALPNRWLVTRFLIQGGQASSKAWIIESDVLSSAPPNGKNAPTLPAQDAQQNFRYVGVWQVFDGNWVEPNIPAGQTIKALFGSEIHAVASGDIAFAAFYPNARNVFGFYDDVADVSVSGDTPVNLMYAVTGWFSDGANDPLSKNLTLEELQQQYAWTYGDGGGATPAYSLYAGLVQDIGWNPNTQYITDSDTPVSLDVAVGNNPAETMAAYFRGVNAPTLTIYEQLLTMFEMGLLSTYKQPKPGQMADLAETLHEKMFSSVDAGTIYTIVLPSADDPNSLDDQNTAPNLPLPLADALNLLNEYQQQYDMATVEVEQYRWQVFADWYRIFQVDVSSQNYAFNTFVAHYQLNQTVQQNLTAAQTQCAHQLTAVKNMLSGQKLVLKALPAPVYWAPNEPVVLVAGQDIEAARRYGGDGRFHDEGYLVCRLTTQVLTAIQVNVNGPVTLDASQFGGALPPGVGSLPYGTDCSNLSEEACLLNTSLVAARAGGSDATLAPALGAWLNGTEQSGNPYQQFTGTLPSPVAVRWWQNGNPWFPLILLWEADFHPLMPTTQGAQLQNYSPQIFTANYAVNPNYEGLIAYKPPQSGTGVINIDPKTIDFDPNDSQSGTQKYTGASVLSATAADNLQALLTTYLAQNKDDTLKAVLGELNSTNILLQAMSGFNDALLMREQSLQLHIATAPGLPLPFRTATNQANQVIGDIGNIPALVPNFNGFFNPLRAGYVQIGLRLLDAFGQKRPVQIGKLYLADSVSTYYDRQLEPGIIYLQPRLSQPSRLLFRWLAADTTEYDEMNAHPATSPVCGWLLTNHLSGGFFIYNQQGKALGSLTVSGDNTKVEWQATPGDDSTINEDLATVMRYENVHLRDLAVALSESAPFFQAFWKAVDYASTFITRLAPNSDAGMAALVGQPVALVQASLLLQQQGMTATNLSLNTLNNQTNEYQDTDNQLGGVQFPVILGDLQEIDDGLVGYFKQGGTDGYDFSTFYSEGASAMSTSGVVQPSATNLLLTPNSTPEGHSPNITQGEQKVLMLVDPRAGIHATAGILPTQYVEIPPYQYADTLAGLEMTFLTTPVLKESTGLSLPVPAESGYVWSWVEEEQVAGVTSEWIVTPNIGAPTANAVWQYTPQSVTEGWLRLNPKVLKFALLNGAGAPVVTAGAVNDLTLTITNLRQSSITFTPGVLTNEGTPPQGSVFYIHFGALVESAKVASIKASASGWTFQTITDSTYGTYLAATPAAGQPLTLAPGQSQQISVSQVQAAATGTQAQIYFDYYDVQGDNDGVNVAVVAIQSGSG